MRKYQIISIVTTLFAILAVFAVVLVTINKNKAISTKKAIIQEKTEQYQKLQRSYKKLKTDRLSKYSAANLNQSSMNAKTNINNFFAAVNTWDGNTYADRANKAKKYATNDVVTLFVGDTSNSESIKKQAKSLKENQTEKELKQTNWYIEKTTGNNVKGLAIITTVTSVQDANKQTTQQMYQITYNVPQKKITKASPVDLSSNNSIDFGD
ncbi:MULTISPECIES: hypothetical protein [Liquorilactobacillus]|uniref:hypothetical protein n=1 Tax=Liquorilactobacillus TaxID=2767888 RepID=UPI001CC03247|nr:hypothetical protein [Liquorilactobacillus hordei]MBZ2406640.1 hypothetical protein [Liquorilactobacillus hordei]